MVLQTFQPWVLESRNYTKLKESVVTAYKKTRPELLEKLMKTTALAGCPLYLQEMSAIAIWTGARQVMK